ncbi:hypothetical protein [Enterobacter hormaechei]|uniref:hypothetical protein n=1 Tax=Enterobacter hormaechei TaxID=158836 RepID=UPI0029307D44|nr:hypothetical protein [Enterobacter hormaechei]
MAELTKEWLLKTIAELEEERDATPGAVNEDAANALAAMKITLASLEAEPDYMRYDCGCCGWETIEDWRENDVCPKCNHHPMGKTPLYTAPPALVSVPDEATAENIEILASTFAPRGVTYQWDRDECNAAADSWNACRAAMLQSFGNSEQLNSPVIPDGWKLVPIELTGDMTNAMSEAILDDLHNVDVWRSVLAAAPQQEVTK